MTQLVDFCLPPTSTSVYSVEQSDAGPGAYMWVAWLWVRLITKYARCRQGGSVTDGSFYNAENYSICECAVVRLPLYFFLFLSFSASQSCTGTQADFYSLGSPCDFHCEYPEVSVALIYTAAPKEGAGFGDTADLIRAKMKTAYAEVVNSLFCFLFINFIFLTMHPPSS